MDKFNQSHSAVLDELLLESGPNVIPFQPLGRRKMREWIEVNLSNSEGYRHYLDLFEESIQYMLNLQ